MRPQRCQILAGAFCFAAEMRKCAAKCACPSGSVAMCPPVPSELEVSVHACRRLLEQRLTLNAEMRTHFVAGLQEQLGDAAVLHAALKPMAVTGVSPVACLPAVSLRGRAERGSMAENRAASPTFMSN